MASPTDPKRRIFVVDDQPIVREGFARAFEHAGDLELSGYAGTAVDALAACTAAQPDVVLLDLDLPDRDGAEFIVALRAAVRDAKIIVVSAHADEFRVVEALRAGAHGYLLKTSTVAVLIEGIRTAAGGGTPLTPSLADAVLRAMRRPGKSGGALDTLSARELQVLRLFATGLSTRDVALSLSISPKTVETHRIRIYEKLGCKSVVDLTRIAVRTGLVQA